MITEPEPIEDGRPDGDRQVTGLDVVRGFGREAADRRPIPPWLWGALAGAVAASVVWTALLLAGVGPYHDGRPDLHGYRINGSPCRAGTFDALVTAVGATDTDTTPASIVHGTAVDRAQCTFTASTSPAAAWTTTYTLDLSVDLHKLADTREEFEQEHAFDTSSLEIADSTTRVRGLGDAAYALTFTDQAQELKVLRGGAVITLRLTSHAYWSGSRYGSGPGSAAADQVTAPGAPGLPSLRPALVAGARTLLTSLKD